MVAEQLTYDCPGAVYTPQPIACQLSLELRAEPMLPPAKRKVVSMKTGLDALDPARASVEVASTSAPTARILRMMIWFLLP